MRVGITLVPDLTVVGGGGRFSWIMVVLRKSCDPETLVNVNFTDEQPGDMLEKSVFKRKCEYHGNFSRGEA